MKATELRIGNLVNYRMVDELDNRKEWFEPSVIDAVDLQLIDSDYQPISLTEEWLLKFGFEEFKTGLDESKKSYTYFKKGNFILDPLNFRLLEIDILVELEHVHQLQNLYFALTGKELTIKN